MSTREVFEIGLALWCTHCDWRGHSRDAGWDEDEEEWTCPECGGSYWVRVIEEREMA